MSPIDPYLVTAFLHPLPEADSYDRFLAPIRPTGLVDFVCRLGMGTFCQGLTVMTPGERRRRWGPVQLERFITEGLDSSWDAGVLDPADIADSVVIADSDEGDIYLTCPRYGAQILELPRHDTTIRIIGDSLSDLLFDYMVRYKFAFPFFDPWPYCRRRAAIGFVVRPEIGFDRLRALFNDTWGVAECGSAAKAHSDFFQDLFIPALHAQVGLYFVDERPPQYRLPDGSITVTMLLDLDAVPAAVEFAKSVMLPREASLTPNLGWPCRHSGSPLTDN